MNIAAISGSFRENSINTGLIRALQSIAPEQVDIELIDYRDIPLYNQDVNQKGIPEAVQKVGDAIKAADAIIIATPEYNYSIPGVLKNAIDWLSRMPEQPFDSKPLGIVGASPSFMGTARAQVHLRQVLQYLNPQILNKPEILINNAFDKFDEQGRLQDEQTIAYLQEFMAALIEKMD